MEPHGWWTDRRRLAGRAIPSIDQPISPARAARDQLDGLVEDRATKAADCPQTHGLDLHGLPWRLATARHLSGP